MTVVAGFSDLEPKSCLDIKNTDASSKTGLYTIYSQYGSPYSVYCEMDAAGGGWTLVAAIHENRMDGGRCTIGDRWSSETGNFARNGDSNWENYNTFGRPEYATKDDYKNVGYFEIDAKRIMLMQVPNNTPLDLYVAMASYQYYTPSPFLQGYGGIV